MEVRHSKCYVRGSANTLSKFQISGASFLGREIGALWSAYTSLLTDQHPGEDSSHR